LHCDCVVGTNYCSSKVADRPEYVGHVYFCGGDVLLDGDPQLRAVPPSWTSLVWSTTRGASRSRDGSPPGGSLGLKAVHCIWINFCCAAARLTVRP
jgi:hypothetical protein